MDKEKVKKSIVAFSRKHGDIFENYALDYEKYMNGGDVPQKANADVRYVLKLRKKRLEQRGLNTKYSISSRKPEGWQEIIKKWQDERFKGSLAVLPCNIKWKLKRNGHNVYTEKMQMNLYETLLDTVDLSRTGNDSYCCPNCGYTSTVKQLGEGCPYCRTFFKNTDLYPRISGFYFIKTLAPFDKGLFWELLKFYPFGILLLLIMLLIRRATFTFPWTLISLLIFGWIAAFILMGISLIGRVFFEAGKSLPMLFGSMGSPKKFEQKMKSYDENFSFDYFADKAVHLAEMILYSEEAENLPIYEGEAPGSTFQKIVQIEYTGALALKRFHMDGDLCKVDVNLYGDVLYDIGNKIRRKRQIIRMSMKRDVSKDTDLSASPLKIQCVNCGASFNAMESAVCPYCSTRYENDYSDWTVTSISLPELKISR